MVVSRDDTVKIRAGELLNESHIFVMDASTAFQLFFLGHPEYIDHAAHVLDHQC